MALAFGKAKGKAETSRVKTMEYKDGENAVRLFGGVLPRYVYWLKGKNNKDIPVECLAFSREDERFDNTQEDPVPDFYPDKKCSWSYVINGINLATGEEVAVNLKKKLYQHIVETAESLGDPTDPEEGWDIVFKRVKTGAHAFNVEYNLMPLKCKKRPLTEAERAVVAAAKSIDDKYPRPTPEDIRKLLTKIQTTGSDEGEGDEGTDAAAGEAARELG